MSQKVILVEIEVTSPVGETTTLRFCDRAIRPMPPGDGLRPGAAFDSRMLEAPAFRRLLFDDLASLKPALGVGTLSLANADTALDAYEGWAWGEIGVWLWTEGSPSAEATVVVKGRCTQPQFTRGDDRPSQVRVTLYDYAIEAATTLQTHLFTGGNDGAAVLYEGAEDGLKDTPKPLAYGDLTDAQIPAPQVNAAEQAYQVHDGAVQGPIALFDRGDDFGLTSDGDLSGAAFDASLPAAAHSVTDLGRGLVKFNGAPAGQVTLGCKGDAAGGYVETAGPIMSRLLARVGVPSSRIGTSFATLAAPAVVGFYAGQPTTLRDALEFLSVGAPAAVLPDREGVWQAVKFGPPEATAAFALGETDIVACVTDDSAPPPVGEVKVGYGRIWRTFAGTELAAALVGTDAQARLASEFRWITLTDAAVKARFPSTWSTVTLQTALRSKADAEALAALIKVLFALKDDGRPRRFWRLTVPLETALACTLGETVQVTYPRRGLAGNYLLVGEEPLRPRRNQAVMTVWG